MSSCAVTVVISVSQIKDPPAGLPSSIYFSLCLTWCTSTFCTGLIIEKYQHCPFWCKSSRWFVFNHREGDNEQRVEGVYPSGPLCLFLSHKQIFTLPFCPNISHSFSLFLSSFLPLFKFVLACPIFFLLYLVVILLSFISSQIRIFGKKEENGSLWHWLKLL